MFISFFSGKVMLFYGISLIMKEKSNASALISSQTHSYLGADALVSGAAFVGKYKERIGRDMDWGGEILLKIGIPNSFLLFA